jgi:hypothetical protein
MSPNHVQNTEGVDRKSGTEETFHCQIVREILTKKKVEIIFASLTLGTYKYRYI